MLWNNTQESWREFLIRCYRASAGELKLTLEWAADAVVQVHNANSGQDKTGLHFNPASVTEENRRKANCIQLQRYMEKEDVIELLPYILGGMSEQAKLAFANQYLRPAGLTVHLLDKESEEGLCLEEICDTQISAAEAMSAITRATMNPTAENLDVAEREAVKAVRKFERTRKLLAGARAKFKGALHKVMHRKERV